jgi:hypothetical protein
VEHQPWFDELRKEFVRRQLPPHYAQRLLAELSDHFNDFKEDRMSTDAADFKSVVHQLGSPRDIGAAATAQYRRQRFSGRHPLLVFAVLPIVSLPMLFVGLLFGVGWMLYLIAPEETLAAGGVEPDWVPLVFQTAVCAFVILPAIALSLMLCRAARKAALGWKWPLAACLLLALLSGSAFTKVVRQKSADKPGLLMIGLGIPLPSQTPLQLVQMIAPLAVGSWAIWRRRKESKQMSVA